VRFMVLPFGWGVWMAIYDNGRFQLIATDHYMPW